MVCLSYLPMVFLVGFLDFVALIFLMVCSSVFVSVFFIGLLLLFSFFGVHFVLAGFTYAFSFICVSALVGLGPL